MNTNPNLRSQEGHQLLQAGALLFILGLLVGFAVPLFANPRVALSSHLEGVMNGTVLLVLGLVWPRLRLDRTARRTGFWLVLGREAKRNEEKKFEDTCTFHDSHYCYHFCLIY